MLLSIHEIKPGMELEQSIYAPNSDKCLLHAGVTLTIRNIEKIKKYKIEDIHIVDRYTVFINPDDKIAESIVKDYITTLRQICPKRPESNMNDHVVKVAKDLEAYILKISKFTVIMPFLVELKLIDNQKLYNHSIHTAVLSGIIAGCMNLKPEDILSTIIGALLHNIGMCEMPMLIGEENFSGQQEALYKEHPTYGYYFAVQKNIPKKIADCIQYHHEKWDGSGYPKGLKNVDIPLSARIVSLCASYSADITYKGVPHYVAIEKLYSSSGIYFDYNVVNAFIQNIPVYPLGQMVRLSSGEVGIVSNIRKNEGPRPVVKVYYNRVNRPISEDKIIDLGVERTIFIEEIL